VEKLLTSPIFVVFASLTLISMVATIGYFWQRVRRDEIDASLKHSMLEKGMSADDIVKVLETNRGDRLGMWDVVAGCTDKTKARSIP